MISKQPIQTLLCQSPVIASVKPGDWMFTKKVLPSGEKVAPARHPAWEGPQLRTGSLTFTIADTTRASKIVGLDPSVGYLEYARANNPHPHVTFEMGDVQNLPYDDGSFDCCVSSLMIQFVLDAHRAVQEMRRVTKAGGTVATCMWDNAGGMELSQRFWDAAVAVDPEAKRPDKMLMDRQIYFQTYGLRTVLPTLKQKH